MPDTKWVGIVHAADGIRFLSVAPSRGALLSGLATYVGDQAEWTLWPDVASRVRNLVSGGSLEVAIGLYFDSTGERWDRERLHTQEVAVATEASEIEG